MSILPSPAALAEVFRHKYGPPEACGDGPRQRWRHGYFNPDDWYEATLLGLVQPDTVWLDVGCGRELFPSNRPLAGLLAARCKRLVGVDPDPTLQENPFVHEKVAALFDTWDGGRRFDLVTLRMVAEHVADPARFVAAVGRALAPGGRVVVYTVNRWSPVPLLTALVPFRLRHPIKRFLWRTEAKDTFPTAFRMNTRARLAALFAAIGCREEAFARLDDCRALGRFALGRGLELGLWRLLRACGLGYPEACLLGVYRAPLQPAPHPA